MDQHALKRIRLLTISLIAIISLSLAQIGFGQKYFFKTSRPKENIFVRINLTVETTNLLADKKITFGFFEKTNEVPTPLIYLPKPEYYCQMQLVNSNGMAINKTWTGKKYGEEFYDLKTYSWASVNKRGHNTGGTDRPDMVLLDTDVTEGQELPAVEELFKIKEPGNYKLLLQFQVIKMIGRGSNHTFKVVHVPEVVVPVIKPPE